MPYNIYTYIQFWNTLVPVCWYKCNHASVETKGMLKNNQPLMNAIFPEMEKNLCLIYMKRKGVLFRSNQWTRKISCLYIDGIINRYYTLGTDIDRIVCDRRTVCTYKSHCLGMQILLILI